MNRTNHALDEHTFIQNTSNTLDQYIAHGQAILGDLQTQRDFLKGALLACVLLFAKTGLGTKRRLLSAANTLGLSRETIQFIEKRGRGDLIVLAVGATTTLFCFWLILHYLG
jgi:Golgi SNAP receptor complex protein 2